MSSPFLGEIRAFGFNFAPRGWLMCNGQTLAINQNAALFSLLGTNYGGNGTSTFQLPNLQGALAMHVGPSNPQGQFLGEENHTLISTEMAAHSHTVNADGTGTTNVPGNTVILGTVVSNAGGNPPVPLYETAGTNPVALPPLGSIGGSQAHPNMMPGLVMNYCIAMQGIFPSRS